MENQSLILMTAENPDGYKLEDLLDKVISEVEAKSLNIVDDESPYAKKVISNNARVIQLLSMAKEFQMDSVASMDVGKSEDSPSPEEAPHTATPSVVE